MIGILVTTRCDNYRPQTPSAPNLAAAFVTRTLNTTINKILMRPGTKLASLPTNWELKNSTKVGATIHSKAARTEKACDRFYGDTKKI